MLEVLVASTASGLMRGSSCAYKRALGLDVLEDGLDHHIGVRGALAGDVRAQAAEGLGRGLRVLQALLEELPWRASSAG